MKKRRKKILAMLSAVIVLAGLFNFNVFAKDDVSQESTIIETVEEISEEEFIEALAQDRNITYEEARKQLKESHAKNPYLQMKAPLYKIVYQTRSLTKKGPEGVNLLARIKVDVVVETATAKPIEFGKDIVLKDLRTSGTGSYVRFDGTKDTRIVSKSLINMYALGEIYVDIAESISISGGTLVPVSGGISGTRRFKWLIDETFAFHL